MRFFDHNHLFQIPKCARNKQQFLTPVPNMKEFIGRSFEIEGVLAVWDCALETFSHSDAEGNFHSPIGKRHYLSHSVNRFSLQKKCLTNFIPSFQRARFQPSFHVRRQRSSNLRHASRTHRVDVDWLFERINPLGQFDFH